MSDFDIDGARKAGYSDAEIADYLGKQRNFDVGAARKSGYSDADIVGHLTAPPKDETPKPEPRQPIAASAVSQGGFPMTVARPAENPPAAPSGPTLKPWADLPGNIPESAGNFVNALVQPIIHPVDTAKAVGSMVSGFINKTGRPGNLLREGDPEPTPAELEQRAKVEGPADAVAQYFKDRYGGGTNLRNTLITDPVGTAADVATVLSGGSLLPGKAGQVAGTVSRAVDPVNALVQVPKAAAKVVEPVVSNVLGTTTGAGAESVRAAGRAGREGGENATAFRENMRGQVPVTDVVETAKDAVAQMRAERSKAYKEGMADLSKDKTVMEFTPIDNAVDKAANVGSFKGQTVEPKAQQLVEEMRASVNEWKALDPAEYHTPEGIDALKRRLGNIRDATQPNTPERVAADRIYKAVRDQIADQAPGYSKMMEAYQQASDKLNETTRTLSLGERASGDTAARKLLSSTRNNVQTNYGGRQKLIDALGEIEPTLPYQIAGQGMNALAPRGLVARLTAMGFLSPTNALITAPLLPAFSPRAVGEATYYAGKGAGMADNALALMRVNEANVRRAGRGAYQAGRLKEAQ